MSADRRDFYLTSNSYIQLEIAIFQVIVQESSDICCYTRDYTTQDWTDFSQYESTTGAVITFQAVDYIVITEFSLKVDKLFKQSLANKNIY